MSTARSAADVDAGAIRFSDVLGAEITKIRTLPAVWIVVAVSAGASTLLGIIAATDVVRVAGQAGPADITKFGTLMLAPMYAFIAIAVFAAGSEYRGGQLRLSLAATPDRHRFFTAKLLAVAAVTGPAAMAALLPGFAIQHASAVSTEELAIGDAAAGFGRLVLAYLLFSLIGYGFAFAAKTVVTPVAVLFAMPILVSTTLGGVLPKVVRLLPHEATLGFLGMPTGPVSGLGRGPGLLVLTTWTVLVVVAAWALVTRRDA